MNELSAPRYIMPMSVSSWQNCDDQQFRTLTYVYVVCTLYNFVNSRMLDLFIRTLLLDHILVLKKQRVRLEYSSLPIKKNLQCLNNTNFLLIQINRIVVMQY